MRRTRWLLLAAILAITAWVGSTYLTTKAISDKGAPVAPARLAEGVDARSQDWTYTKTNGGQQQFVIRAKDMRQTAGSTVELEGVELRLFNKDGSEYNLVHCAKAEF